MKESEVQYGEKATKVARPSVSASGSRGTFSCRRWRLLTGKPKDDEVLSHKPRAATASSRIVERPTTAAVDSKNWATAATPFAAFLPRDTIVPITSRKSVAAAVLTSTHPQEKCKEFDREMAICERKHVKAMGRMTTRIYRKGEEHSESVRSQKTREKKTIKDQIYLPVLCQTRTDEPRDLSPRISKLLYSSSQQHTSQHATLNSIPIPDSLAGMKLLSSQFDELRASLENSSKTKRLSENLWYPTPRHPAKLQSQDTASSSSSIETLLLRVLDRPLAILDGYQADHEENSSDMDTMSLESRSANNSEADLQILLSALDSSSRISCQEQAPHPASNFKPDGGESQLEYNGEVGTE
ncbi:hypothetical protein F442_09729 [Phytophthora nicotianae P10297]|uniref:Uncharacterized protein n=1 Tax=Phytophthora nicotianae P10297 TaxID=1317064 RepID=W2Z868_PHYNI|nr:hypothetical protein F442_09729 [Phytophthora nicotianae P10297]